MSVRFNSGQVLLESGSVAMHEDCCCCECTVPDQLNGCQCLSADYTKSTRPDAQVVITGSATPTSINAFGITCPAGTAPSINGTYAVSCQDDGIWAICNYVCTRTVRGTSYDYYYVNGVWISYQLNGAGGVKLEVQLIGALLEQITGTPTPACSGTVVSVTSLPLGTINAIEKSTWNDLDTSVGAGTYDRWRYVLGGDCTTDCNEVTTGVACTTGSLGSPDTVIIDPAIWPSNNVCDVRGHSIAASLI